MNRTRRRNKNYECGLMEDLGSSYLCTRDGDQYYREKRLKQPTPGTIVDFDCGVHILGHNKELLHLPRAALQGSRSTSGRALETSTTNKALAAAQSVAITRSSVESRVSDESYQTLFFENVNREVSKIHWLKYGYSTKIGFWIVSKKPAPWPPSRY